MATERLDQLTQQDTYDALDRLEELLRQSAPQPTPTEQPSALGEPATCAPSSDFPRSDQDDTPPAHRRLRPRAQRRRELVGVGVRRSAVIAVSGGLLVTMVLPAVVAGSESSRRSEETVAVTPPLSDDHAVGNVMPQTVTVKPGTVVQIAGANGQAPVIVNVESDGGDGVREWLDTASTIAATLLAVWGASAAIKRRRRSDEIAPSAS